MPIFRRDEEPDDVDVMSCLANLERLEALSATKALDAPPRDDLDELTRAAAERLGAPIALLSLVDDHRQFFASAVGLPQDWAEARETPLEYSYCKHVVAAEDVLWIENSTADSRVAQNLSTTERGLRAYLGVPIRRSGQVLGSFCVIDVQPREWSDSDLEALAALAERINSAL
jgi:GAF domain-containing protein